MRPKMKQKFVVGNTLRSTRVVEIYCADDDTFADISAKLGMYGEIVTSVYEYPEPYLRVKPFFNFGEVVQYAKSLEDEYKL